MAELIVILLAGAAVVAGLAALRHRQLNTRSRPNGPDFRTLVLSRSLPGSGGASTPAPSAAAMDWNVGGGVSTLVAFSDGTVSLYYSGDGGIIGAGTHEQIRAPGMRFHALLSQLAERLVPTTQYPLPPNAKVTFWLACADATLASDHFAPEELADTAHPFHAVHAHAQATITALREHQNR